MKIKDLILELSKCDPEALVVTYDEFRHLEVTEVTSGVCLKQDCYGHTSYGFEREGYLPEQNNWKTAVCLETEY